LLGESMVRFGGVGVKNKSRARALVEALRAADSFGVGSGRRFARANVLGRYENSREKTARKESAPRRFVMSELKLRPPKKPFKGEGASW
jgi:hypothetical protein